MRTAVKNLNPKKFDINEWENVRNNYVKNSVMDNRISWGCSIHTIKKTGSTKKYLTISFGSLIYKMLKGAEERVIIFQHKDNPKRILLIPSANGSKMASPSDNYYFLKTRLP